MAERVPYMSPVKKRAEKKATTLEKSTADADEDDRNKSPIRTLTWGRDAPSEFFLAIRNFYDVAS